MRSLLAIVVVVLAGSGCESSSPTPLPPAPDPQPHPVPTAAAKAKCENFIAVACARNADCSNDPPDRAQRLELCKQQARTGIDCGKAVTVSESYDRCIRELGETSCEVLIASGYPKSCDKVILVAP